MRNFFLLAMGDLCVCIRFTNVSHTLLSFLADCVFSIFVFRLESRGPQLKFTFYFFPEK